MVTYYQRFKKGCFTIPLHPRKNKMSTVRIPSKYPCRMRRQCRLSGSYTSNPGVTYFKPTRGPSSDSFSQHQAVAVPSGAHPLSSEGAWYCLPVKNHTPTSAGTFPPLTVCDYKEKNVRRCPDSGDFAVGKNTPGLPTRHCLHKEETSCLHLHTSQDKRSAKTMTSRG